MGGTERRVPTPDDHSPIADHRVERRGDVERARHFKAFYEEHYQAVTRFVVRAYARFDVDDVVAATFAIAWERFDAVPASSPLPWLFGVARNVARNAARSARRSNALYVKLARERSLHFEDHLDEATLEWTDVVARAWTMLPPDDREVLALAIWEDLSSAGLATVLGCTRGAARVRLSRARRRLRLLVGREAEVLAGRGGSEQAS